MTQLVPTAVRPSERLAAAGELAAMREQGIRRLVDEKPPPVLLVPVHAAWPVLAVVVLQLALIAAGLAVFA